MRAESPFSPVYCSKLPPTSVDRVSLPVVVELGKATISLKELLSLEVGDVVVLDKRVGEPLNILVGKKVKMKGMPGRSGRRLAIKITELEEEE